MRMSFLDEIYDLLQANGWEGQLVLEVLQSSTLSQDNGSQRQIVRVLLSQDHPFAPSEIVNEYEEGVHPLEQIQQECFRALRTGRSGL